MAAPGSTEIILYNSATAAAVPLAGNLKQGELAVNVTDKKIYSLISSTSTVVKMVGSLGSQDADDVAITGGTIDNVTIGGITPVTSGTFVDVSISNDLTFTSTGNRILGDFSNGTVANQVLFKSSTVDGDTSIAAIPNGTSASAGFTAINNSTPTNSSTTQVLVNATASILAAGKLGSGSYLPLALYTGGAQRLQLDTNGNLGVGSLPVNYGTGYVNFVVGATTSPVIDLNVNTTRIGSFYATSGEVDFGTVTDVPLYVRTNDTIKMAITGGTGVSGGFVGLGTSSPSAKLAVVGTGYSPNIALTDATTIAWDTQNGQVATFTFVSSNRTVGAPTNLVSGGFYALAVIQNAGSNTLTWNSVFKWNGGVAPILSTGAGAKDYFVFRSDGTNLYEQGRSLGVA
jgi:hypothetical protein